jgi:hypothetical protein
LACNRTRDNHVVLRVTHGAGERSRVAHDFSDAQEAAAITVSPLVAVDVAGSDSLVTEKLSPSFKDDGRRQDECEVYSEPSSVLSDSKSLKRLAGGLGFEPRLAESESAVLPLDDPPPAIRRAPARPICGLGRHGV